MDARSGAAADAAGDGLQHRTGRHRRAAAGGAAAEGRLTRPPPIFPPLAAALLLAALYAATFGFLSTDSWNYLAMAQGLRRGAGCAVEGQYFAVFPCLYPALIALAGWSSDLVALFAASKLVNLALWLAAAALIHGLTRHWAATLVFALNPVSLLLLLYTWSEGLMLLAVAGALWAIRRCATRPDAAWKNAALLAGFLIAGGASRYVFAPFMAVLALGAAVAYGRAAFVRTLPGFAVGAVFAGAYQVFNRLHTGFATGMPRVPAPESAAELVAAFAAFVARQSLDFVVLLLVIAGIVFLLQRRRPLAWQRSPEALLLTIAGLGYLALAFALRFVVLFDPYNARTVGPGVVLAASGIAAVILPREVPRAGAHAVAVAIAAFACAFSVSIGTGALARQARHAVAAGAWPVLAVARLLDSYPARDLPPGIRTVVSFGVPVFPEPYRIGWNARLYYPPPVALVEARLPEPESAEAFEARLRAVPMEGCYLDFAIFRDDAHLRTWLGREMAADVARRLAAIGRPGQVLPCARYWGAGPG